MADMFEMPKEIVVWEGSPNSRTTEYDIRTKDDRWQDYSHYRRRFAVELERRYNIHDKLVEALEQVKKLMVPEGEYAICRKDESPMEFADQMTVGEIFLAADKALALASRKEGDK